MHNKCLRNNCILINVHIIRYHWVDTSAGGLLVPEGIISPVVNVSVLTWFIIYLHVLLKFTDPK